MDLKMTHNLEVNILFRSDYLHDRRARNTKLLHCRHDGRVNNTRPLFARLSCLQDKITSLRTQR
jgi:hypothetical protein